MLKRCYNVEYSKKDNAYMDCEVCDEWFNFQNFAKWYDENFYEIEGEKIHLDKDILIKGNKIYSPETCVFVPARINILFAKSKSKRGDYPIGVHLDKRTNKFISSCRDKTKYDYLGSFEVIEYAFQTYKIHKEKLIKQVAEDYKEKIPAKLYNAMMNYIVEITD
jgi:hypothetical protein